MKKIPQKIEKLLRTNTALFLLCIISVGVLVQLWRGSRPVSGQSRGDAASIATDIKADASSPPSSASEPKGEQIIAAAFRGMPDPESFTSFIYEGEESISVSIKCNDEYSVVMIFPAEIDYRSDVLSARYNSAEPCKKGAAKTEKISIKGFGLEQGHEYYIVKASQGRKGMWHDPY